MKPKSYKNFKNDLSEKIGVHPDVVDDFIAFYYSKVRKHLSDLSYPSIVIYGLGTFRLRKKILDKTIKKNKSILGNLSKNTYMGYEKHIGVKDKLEKMITVKKIIDQEIQEKKEFKEKNGS